MIGNKQLLSAYYLRARKPFTSLRIRFLGGLVAEEKRALRRSTYGDIASKLGNRGNIQFRSWVGLLSIRCYIRLLLKELNAIHCPVQFLSVFTFRRSYCVSDARNRGCVS